MRTKELKGAYRSVILFVLYSVGDANWLKFQSFILKRVCECPYFISDVAKKFKHLSSKEQIDKANKWGMTAIELLSRLHYAFFLKIRTWHRY